MRTENLVSIKILYFIGLWHTRKSRDRDHRLIQVKGTTDTLSQRGYEIIYGDAHAISVLSQSQLALRRDTVSHGSASEWLIAPLGLRPTVDLRLSIPGWEAEVLGRALKITQDGIIKRSYRSILQSVFVSLCLSICLSLSHHKTLDSKKNKESYIFITKCYGHSFWLYNRCSVFHISVSYVSKFSDYILFYFVDFILFSVESMVFYLMIAIL